MKVQSEIIVQKILSEGGGPITYVKFCIGRTFLTNLLNLQMYTFLETKFHEEYNGDVNLLPKITLFEKIMKNTVFVIFLSKQAAK